MQVKAVYGKEVWSRWFSCFDVSALETSKEARLTWLRCKLGHARSEIGELVMQGSSSCRKTATGAARESIEHLEWWSWAMHRHAIADQVMPVMHSGFDLCALETSYEMLNSAGAVKSKHPRYTGGLHTFWRAQSRLAEVVFRRLQIDNKFQRSPVDVTRGATDLTTKIIQSTFEQLRMQTASSNRDIMSEHTAAAWLWNHPVGPSRIPFFECEPEYWTPWVTGRPDVVVVDKEP